jgi:predicted dienelactone hydrolase
MRPLEIVIPLVLALSILWPEGAIWTSGLAIIAILIHLVVEKFRWQMVPLYVLSGILFLSSLLQWKLLAAGRATPLALGGVVLFLLVLAICTALPWLLPVPRPPGPTGRYKVGTITRFLVDKGRRELYSGLDEPRQFVVQLWYPAMPSAGAAPAPWMPDARRLGRLISTWIKMPRFFLDHLGLVKSHSYLDAPLERSGGPYPVLIFSHGWGGFRAQNTYQTQELASQGYVVVGLEHPYGSMVTVLPDGRVAKNNPAALPYNDPRPEYLPAARRLAGQWAGDIRSALDYLGELNRGDPDGRFTGSLDLDKLGLFGHSTGAGAVLEFAGTDARAKAAFAEDIYLTPVSEQVLASGSAQPIALMFSQIWADDRESENNQSLRDLETRLGGPHYVTSIRGTTHYDFTDLPSLSPLAHALGLKGPIRGKRVHQIVNAYSVAFFDTYLKSQPAPLLSGPSLEYPEVIFQRWEAAGSAGLTKEPDDERSQRAPEERDDHIGAEDEQDRQRQGPDGAARTEPVGVHHGNDQNREAPESRDHA